MGELADAIVLAAVAVGSFQGASALARASWPHRSPAAAIFLWQSLGLAGGLASVGALLAVGASGSHAGSVAGALRTVFARMADGQVGGHQPEFMTLVQVASLTMGVLLLALLWWVLLLAFTAVVHARHRQRELLALLAHGDPKAPGALVVDHPAAAAYCLPGLRSTIVVSVGTLDLLAPAELAAVLAHERAHLRARHDLVLIPFTSLRRAFPRSRVIGEAYRRVALLVEMMADDHALRALPVRDLLAARELAKALLRFGAAGTSCAPEGALAAAPAMPGAAGGEIAARVTRLLGPRPLPRSVQAAIIAGAALLIAGVTTLFFL